MIMKKEKNKRQTSKEKGTKESSELEKEIEETESQETNKALEKTSEETVDDNEFREFIQSSIESFSPVLQKVETPQQESLEQDVASAPVASNINEAQIDYSITSNAPDYSAGEEIKYQINIQPTVLKPAEISENLPRQEFLNPMVGRMIDNRDNLRPNMVNTKFIEEKRRLPFEGDDKKYKEFKL